MTLQSIPPTEKDSFKSFPRLMRSKHTGNIVLMLSDQRGILVRGSKSILGTDMHIGQELTNSTSPCVFLEDMEDYNGQIVLENLK